ncbi:hypothetical protein PV10_06372 [Exophiala mesophila]|uniref:Uncharacterized protein n=1 Tax=Exophiala mesophila TaxID=212818 RepID=A0A0D1XUK0_EXOME|nr:uncharacterized protein PV10_06372 [Exophiala mesophila]KIV91881.1 hypothetical protein PV10_06372 [Exophiala mesophila]
MSELVFIDVRDQSGQNQRQVKSHVASGTHRQKRLVAIEQYQKNADRDDEQSASQDLSSEATTSNIDVSGLQQPQDPTQDQYSVEVPSPSLTSVKASSHETHVQILLQQSSNWIQYQYRHFWSVKIRQDPLVYDLNTSIETFRESFYIVSDLLAMGKVNPAFEVLKYTLDSVPDLLRNPHPELLFALLEVASGINMPAAINLQSKVKTHLADMARVIFGMKHPATLLLTTDFESSSRNHTTQLLMACIINTLSMTFGSDAYQTLVHQLGQSQFYMRAGHATVAQETISNVLRGWMEQYGDDAALSRLAMLELSMMRLHACHDDPIPFEAEVTNSLQWIEVISGISGSQPTGILFPESSPASPDLRTKTLARWFLLRKRYTLALHVYNLTKGLPDQRTAPHEFHEPGGLAGLMANIVQDALGDALDLAEDINDIGTAVTQHWLGERVTQP